MRFNYDLARMARGVTPIVHNITTRHAEHNNILKDALQQPEGAKVYNISNDDGTRQFILGVDSLDDEDVTIGIA